MEIPLARPDITEVEVQAVLEVLRSPCLSSGPKKETFEKRVAEYVGVRYAVAVNSGTRASFKRGGERARSYARDLPQRRKVMFQRSAFLGFPLASPPNLNDFWP